MLANALKELKRAEESLVQLRAAQDVETMDACWVNLVRYLERAWNKAQAEMKRESKWQGWPERGRIESLRSSDPLLAYLRNARGAEEHGIDAITHKKSGGIGIKAADGKGLYLERLSLHNGRITELRSPQQVRISVIPAEFSLAPVKNRGQTYVVPTSHLSSPLPGSSPVDIAIAGIAFYRDALAQIKKDFRK